MQYSLLKKQGDGVLSKILKYNSFVSLFHSLSYNLSWYFLFAIECHTPPGTGILTGRQGGRRLRFTWTKILSLWLTLHCHIWLPLQNTNSNIKILRISARDHRALNPKYEALLSMWPYVIVLITWPWSWPYNYFTKIFEAVLCYHWVIVSVFESWLSTLSNVYITLIKLFLYLIN